MKAFVLTASLLALSAPVLADDLADANKALEAKSYATAIQLYQKLAAAGNAEAQFHLGEMNWYGEGVAQNDAQARSWFGKAAAAGSKEAGAALHTMDLHDARKADIEYWTTRYDGADLNSGQYACKAPVFPKVSDTNAQIKEKSAEYAAWTECYNAKVAHLSSLLPPGKAIPKDLADLMNQREYDAAVARLDKVYAQVAASEKASAGATMSAHDEWYAATQAYAKRHNDQVAEQTKIIEYDLRRGQNLIAPPSVPVAQSSSGGGKK
ncbi:MAG: tetratricopeptide repeat protein [Telluria sp.]